MVEQPGDAAKVKKAASRKPSTSVPSELEELAREVARLSGAQPLEADTVEADIDESTEKRSVKAKKQLDLF